MKFKKVFLLLSIVGLLAGCGKEGGNSSLKSFSSAPTYDAKIKSIDVGPWLTGPDANTNTQDLYGLGSTDLGIPIYDAQHNKMYFAFGDSYVGSLDKGGVRSGNWVSNVFGYTSDFDASNGITFDGFLNNNGKNTQIIPSYAKGDKFSEWTIIPTGGIIVNNNFYVFCMSVREWGSSGIWTINFNVCYKSSDEGKTWTKCEDLLWIGHNDTITQEVCGQGKNELAKRVSKNFLQMYPVLSEEDGYIYIYGIGEGRTEGMKLARVKPENIEKFEEYEYFSGLNNDSPIFIKGSEGLKTVSDSDDAYIIDPQCAEPSIMYNKYLKKWVVMTMRGNRELYMHLGDKPWGNFDQTILVCTQVNFPGHYGGFIHEKYTEQDGKIMYLFLSLWNQYNVKILKIEMA